MSKKFAASYSGGKDSVLSIYKALRQGLTPIALITTYNTDKNRSWFHGIPEPVLESVSQSLEIPIWLIKTSGQEYAANFEKALSEAKELGAELCVFGDIDIEGHIQWCTERCENVGLTPMFPLLGKDRRVVVHEFIDSGFTANITIINTNKLSGEFIGQVLTKETALRIAEQGADICGENGEYHTFVSAGPVFTKPVQFSLGERIDENEYAILPLLYK